MTDGKWTCSPHEERWDNGEEFDTREEAFAYARGDFAEEHDIGPGGRVYVGRIAAISRERMADYAIDAERIIEDIDELLYESVGDEVTNELTVTVAQREDLDRRLVATIVQWMIEHDIKAPCWTIENATSHVVGDEAES